MTTDLMEVPVLSGINHSSCDIIVYNDNHNSFEHVIETFVDVLRHSSEQAEQCAHIIHNKGKCQVKHGTFEELQPLAEALIMADLSADIE